MPRARLFLTASLLALALFAASASAAGAAAGVASAKALGSASESRVADKSGGATGAPAKGGPAKESLAISTQSPADGQTLSGQVSWQVVVSGSASRVEFLVDGAARESLTSSPYVFGGSAGLDTTKLANGTHVLSAVAYGSKGIKATTKVTVTVSNRPLEPPSEEPAPEEPPTEEPLPESGQGGPLYWGAWIGNQLTGDQAPWDMNAVSKFEGMTGKALSLVEFGQPFSSCGGSSCSFYAFPWTPLENVRQHGAIPVLSWSSQSIPSTTSEPDYQLSDVISGRYDTYIRAFAEKAKSWGHPFFLRFDWEMNGNWFPWSEGVNGNKSGEYVAAWRHVHDIFASVGATNVSWVWCPNVEWNGTLSNIASNYPGDEYVDWTGLDGYNWGTNPARDGKWETFRQLYRSTYRYITETVAPAKPMMIGEVASSEYGGSKATWIREMLSQIPTEYPKIRALLWFERYDSGMDWPLETSRSAETAFAEGMRNSLYEGSLFSSLPLLKSISPAI